MAVVVEPEAGAKPGSDGPADVFVAFGITRDPAKVMTFRSLYRLERRGLLDCPVLGQDGAEEACRVMAPLIESPPPVHPYEQGTWGPKAADHLLAGTSRRHEPWVA